MRTLTQAVFPVREREGLGGGCVVLGLSWIETSILSVMILTVQIILIVFQPNNLGVGVVGLVDVTGLMTPTHNKQEFNQDIEYRYTHFFVL